MTRITLDHVNKRFHATDGIQNTVVAADDISLTLQTGEILAILGPSGCGKSTLLRIIAGLMQPDSGQILYDKKPLKNVPIEERGIGMVFQEGALMPHWEAGRSVSFFLSLRKREHEVPERVQRISKITGIGLNELMRKQPRQLSGGEKQRVSIARALARDLRILLFDEPFANIDGPLRTEARVELKRLLNEFPTTSIYVTHDQAEAIALSRRIAVMRNGQFDQIGTYQQLYESPRNLFVAEFIGTPTMNIFDGKVIDGQWFGEDFGGFPIRSDLPNGMAVKMGIRPDHIFLHNDGVAGVVDQAVPYLAERYQLVEVWLGKERWNLTVPLDQQIDVGSTIYCDMDASHAHYFDAETGLRIG